MSAWEADTAGDGAMLPRLPTRQCLSCRKFTDAALVALPGEREDVFLCGSDYDAWLGSPEYRRGGEMPRASCLMDFVNRRNAERLYGNRAGARPLPFEKTTAELVDFDPHGA